MIENRQAVDMIERAHDAEPFCACGRYTSPVGRAYGIWLECSGLREEPKSRLHAFVAALTAPSHTRRLIVDLRPVAA